MKCQLIKPIDALITWIEYNSGSCHIFNTMISVISKPKGQRRNYRRILQTRVTESVCESDDEITYEVEAELKRRTVGPKNNKRTEVLVKWLGWSKRFNTWIPESQLSDL